MGFNDEIKIYNGIANGDSEILKEFYRRNFNVIRNLIVQNSGSEKDSEDVFQDALIVLYEKLKLDSFTLKCSIHTYFYGICKNIWLHKLNRSKKRSCCGQIDDTILNLRASAVDISKNEQEQLYRKHLLSLNCKCKNILFLFFEGKSMREISMLTNYSEGYVRKRKFECKKHLIKLIESDPLYKELIVPKRENLRKNVS
ncbi:RNA polymerase sigma factor [Aquimarina litoralis]|uniref:RNA polymerase sigma factor n=1 Tax=Aquimarina litoralis TaxID=584605 RepID=UPI001C58B7EC|nr:sigma-70 family RNA polymerase sigma factor [Aquimarina litoralis]MBW1294274.1 sigma-70 family RNA polymerase sigma factor [Aquimarina litoralis]